MIFVTIGTQAPFERLIKAIDEVAPHLDGVKVVAQVFESSYIAKNIETVGFLPPKEFNHYFEEASLIVSHAGMGTILSALTNGKPLLIIPRLTKFGEHRNDHQLATAKKMQDFENIHVAFNEEELKRMLLQLVSTSRKKVHHNKFNQTASESLIKSIRESIFRRST